MYLLKIVHLKSKNIFKKLYTLFDIRKESLVAQIEGILTSFIYLAPLVTQTNAVKINFT
jgi:hypothetical protein